MTVKLKSNLVFLGVQVELRCFLEVLIFRVAKKQRYKDSVMAEQ